MSDTQHEHQHGPATDGAATDGPAFGAQWWEQHYRDGSGGSASSPTPYVTALGANPGATVLEVGCGTGADAIWLARQGWCVTAMDIAPTAIEQARAHAGQQAPDVADQLTWITADIMTDESLAGAEALRYDLVLSQYVHPDAPYERFVARLAERVAPGGRLLVVGHDHADEHSAEHAPGDASLGGAAVTETLDPGEWTIELAETRQRRIGQGRHELVLTDTVVQARRR